MKKLALLAALVVAVALLVWLLWPEEQSADMRAMPPAATPTKPAEPAPTPLAAVEAPPAPREAVHESAPPAAAPVPKPTTPPPSAPEPSERTYDPDARDWVHVIVQDQHGAPVANADIKLTGLRSPHDPGSHWGWFLEPSVGRTALDGTAKLWFPVWIDADDITGAVTLTVEHPDYITHDENDFTIGPTPRVIVMEQGAFVVVSGWFDSPSEVVKDVVPYMTWGAKIQPDAWLPIKDGRLSCSSIPPGKHGIYLSHTSSEHGPCFSAVQMFEIGVGEQKEIHLQLFKGRKFGGRFDPSVPRPIANGGARINLQVGDRSLPSATMLREYYAPVNADGTFEFTDLPPGDGQIIGSCDGFVSLGVAAGREYLGESVGDEEQAKQRLALVGRVPQTVPADVRGEPFVLRMEPAATLHATVVDKEGKAIQGANVTLWPNVHWRTGYSNLFMQRVCQGLTDDKGQVTITNIPSGQIHGGVQRKDYVLAENERGRRQLDVEFEAGKTKEIRIELVAGSGQ